MSDRIIFIEAGMLAGMEGFKPFGIPVRSPESMELLFKEYKSDPLAGYEILTLEMAALKMDISRLIFTRLCNKTREKVARVFVEGNAIIISGGSYLAEQQCYRCNNCHETTVPDQLAVAETAVRTTLQG